MWELYTFWAFVPVMLQAYNDLHGDKVFNVSLLSFIIIGGGGLACVASGLLSLNYGAKKIATLALTLSGLCCILSPLFLSIGSPLTLIVFLCFWGLVVVADSPLFSTLVAQNSAEESRGSALTIMNCIGFSITIVSIQLTNMLTQYMSVEFIFTVLALGPILGLIALMSNKSS